VKDKMYFLPCKEKKIIGRYNFLLSPCYVGDVDQLLTDFKLL